MRRGAECQGGVLVLSTGPFSLSSGDDDVCARCAFDFGALLARVRGRGLEDLHSDEGQPRHQLQPGWMQWTIYAARFVNSIAVTCGLLNTPHRLEKTTPHFDLSCEQTPVFHHSTGVSGQSWGCGLLSNVP